MQLLPVRGLGALRWFAPWTRVRFITPESNLSCYQFGRRMIKHHFCAICGWATMGAGPHNGAEMFSINVRCLEDADLSALRIKPADGRSFPAS